MVQRMGAWQHGYEHGRMGLEFDTLGYKSAGSIRRYTAGFHIGRVALWRKALHEAKLFAA